MLNVGGMQHIDMECINLLKQTGSFLVPTLVTYDRIKRGGEASGMPVDQVAKVRSVIYTPYQYCVLIHAGRSSSLASPSWDSERRPSASCVYLCRSAIFWTKDWKP